MKDLTRVDLPALLERTLDGLRHLPGVPSGARIVAAMSGGVDSSVMAALLHLAGYEVVGVSMQLFDKRSSARNETADGRCCTLDDFQDARRVAQQMGFSHYVLDFEACFKETVIHAFVESYLAGETPSPCILCNQHLKFKALFDKADELGADHIATGHYARIYRNDEGYHLLKAADPHKDQSYFLFAHTQKTLARTLFPLENLTKQVVREIGGLIGLHLAEKQESQEICFVTQKRYDAFIEEGGWDPGSGGGLIRHVDGRNLGEHEGYWRFTIGQRKGLRVAYPHPLYVVRVERETNTVWVGEENALYQSELQARELSWCLSPPAAGLLCSAKLRSRSADVPAILETIEIDQVRLRFLEPQRAITPGQAVVLYQGSEVLGGGWISRAW